MNPFDGLPEAMKRLREERRPRATQDDVAREARRLAQEAGSENRLDRSAISLYETGQREPGASSLGWFLAALGLDLYDLADALATAQERPRRADLVEPTGPLGLHIQAVTREELGKIVERAVAAGFSVGRGQETADAATSARRAQEAADSAGGGEKTTVGEGGARIPGSTEDETREG